MRFHMGICGIGLGHASRSVPVAKELLGRGHTISLTAYGDALKLLEREGLNAAANISLGYGVSHDGGISVKKTILKNLSLPIKFTAQIAREIAVMDAVKPAAVYSDTRASTVVAAKSLGLPVLTVLNQYNIPLEVRRYRWMAVVVERMIQAPSLIWNMSDVIAVPDLPPPHTISIYTLNMGRRQNGRLEYVGPLITKRILGEDELQRIRRRYGAEDRTLVFIHISGNRPERVGLANKLVPAIKDLVGYRFIISLGNPEGRERADIGAITIFDWVESVDDLIAACDILVARAGLTVISKAIAYGKRLIVIPTPLHGEQIRNARRVEELGFGLLVQEEDLNLKQALEEVDSEGSFQRIIEELSVIASRLGGPSAVAMLLEELVEVI
ncbi:MAG: glycosyltransferase family protein [Nitrososphaerota archaeon]